MPKRYTSSNFKVKGNKLTLNGNEILGNDIGDITFNQELSHIRSCFVSTYDHFYYSGKSKQFYSKSKLSFGIYG